MNDQPKDRLSGILEHPYFMAPAVKLLRDPSATEGEKAALRRLIAANVGDIPSLRLVLGLDPAEFAAFYPDMAGANPGTADTIDTFLSQFGDPTAPAPQAAAQIPVPQYDISELESEPAEPAEPTREDLRRAIKNREYQRALEILERLNLINPEKSVYFADQMRFVRKLIVNANGINNSPA